MLTRRRVVVTGFGAVTPLGHSAVTSWRNLLQGKTGMIALSSSNLAKVPHHFFPKSVSKNPELQKSILDALPARVIAPVPETDSELYNGNTEQQAEEVKELFAATSRTTRHDLFAQFAAIEAMCRSGLLILRHSKTKEILFDASSSSFSNRNSGSDNEENDTSFLQEYRKLRSLIRSGKNSLVAEFNPKFDTIYPSHRRGVNIGIGMNSLHDVSECNAVLYHQSPPKLNRIEPFFIPKILCNTVAGTIAQQYQLMGPCHCTSTACATGLHCIGDGMRWIQHGEADMVVCGATEAAITPLGLAGFGRMKALATKYNDSDEEAQQASRPFDENRCGFVMGEGSGCLVLEDREKALERGLKESDFLCELRGYGMAGDAYHVSSPHPEGFGAGRAMRNAMDDFVRNSINNNNNNNQDEKAAEKKKHPTIDYLNAHATSTPMGDEIELAAAARELRGSVILDDDEDQNNNEKKKKLLVSSNKGNIGHLLGSAGSVESIFAMQSLRHKKVPVTANLENPCSFDEEKIQLKPDNNNNTTGSTSSEEENNNKHVMEIRHRRSMTDDTDIVVMSTSFGFGGTNAALIMTK